MQVKVFLHQKSKEQVYLLLHNLGSIVSPQNKILLCLRDFFFNIIHSQANLYLAGGQKHFLSELQPPKKPSSPLRSTIRDETETVSGGKKNNH